MSGNGDNAQAGPSAFSAYASKFLSGNLKTKPGVEGSQIFRPASPTSPSRDPFISSPTNSQSYPRLRGASRSPSPTPTEPYPGPGIDGIPDIEGSTGMGLLFANPDDSSPFIANPKPSSSRKPSATQGRIPNPYAPSSSDSDEEVEADLDEVATVRRSLLKPKTPAKKPAGAARGKKGWLAHQSVFPPSSSSSSSESESEKETEADSVDDHRQMMGRSRRKDRSRSRRRDDPTTEDDDVDGYSISQTELYRAAANVPPEDLPNDLEEPLLGPDGADGAKGRIPVKLHLYHGRFGHWEREGLRKYKDSGFLALWLTSILGVIVGLLFVWGSTDPPPDAPNRSVPSVIPLLPLLLVLLIPALVLPPAFLLLLRKTVRPILLATAVSIPFSLFVCGWWALGASFETGGLDQVDQGERWWSTTGMRIMAVILWALAALFGRLVWVRRKRLERTVSVVELSTNLLLSHPPLLLLTPLLLAVFAITSIPFLTLLIRLGMIGYWRHPRENTYIYQIRPYAGWLIFLVTLIWVWTWGVIRGVGRVAVAGVVGEWYFHRRVLLLALTFSRSPRREDASHPPAIDITTAAVHRATGTSLGSICLGAGIVATVRVVGRSAAELKRITAPKSKILPTPLSFLSNLTPVFAIVAGVLDQLNGYALVYVGITGDAFWPSARRAVGLAGRRKGGRLLDYTLIKLLLTLSSTSMGLFTATAGYLYMTHSLSNPSYAPIAALLCGGVPFLAIRAGAAVLGDAADALFICHQIDRELGGAHCDEAKEAFGGEQPRGAQAA